MARTFEPDNALFAELLAVAREQKKKADA